MFQIKFKQFTKSQQEQSYKAVIEDIEQLDVNEERVVVQNSFGRLDIERHLTQFSHINNINHDADDEWQVDEEER